MEKYIEVKSLIDALEQRKKQLSLWVDKDSADQRIDEIDCILDVDIVSLQQEQQEVDLEEITKFSRIKELPDGFDKDWLKYYHLDKEYNSVKFHHLSALEREYIIARHFYELGKNSK